MPRSRRRSVRIYNRAFAKAFANKDAEALANLYFENAVLLPPNEPEVIGAEIRKWYAKAFSSGVSDFKMESRTGLHAGDQ